MKYTMKKVLAVMLACILSVAMAYAITYWTSTPVTKHIELHVEGINGLIIDVASYDNYDTKTVPTAINGFGDVRDNSFLAAVEETNIDGDLTLSIDASDVPEGMVITAKMAWALYYRDKEGVTPYIRLFDDAETSYEAYKGNTDEWFDVSFASMRDVDVNGAPTTILNANISQTIYDSAVWIDGSGILLENCNGLWLKFGFDTSGITTMGDYVYDIGITVSLGEL